MFLLLQLGGGFTRWFLLATGVLQTLRLLYEEVDESDVEVVRIVSPTTTLRSKGCVEEYRYPRVGTANARSALKIVTFDVDSSGLVGNESYAPSFFTYISLPLSLCVCRLQ